MISLSRWCPRFYSVKQYINAIKFKHPYNINDVNPVQILRRSFTNETANENRFFPPIFRKNHQYDNKPFEAYCDVLIIGGGAMGSSTAYWLTKKARNGLKVVVLEKDFTVSIT